MSIEKIDAVAKSGGTTADGVPYARLEYYMVAHPKQKNWKKVPGYATGATEEEAMKNAEAIANELDGLTIKEMAAASRKLLADGRLIKITGKY